MTYCQHLTRSLHCADPAQPQGQRGIRCSWRGDCLRERPLEVMLQIEREGVEPEPVAKVSLVRQRVREARDRLAAAAAKQAWRTGRGA